MGSLFLYSRWLNGDFNLKEYTYSLSRTIHMFHQWRMWKVWRFFERRVVAREAICCMLIKASKMN